MTIAMRLPLHGYGSSANGGELLFLALASCYCNDIYREASEMGIKVNSVEVEVSGDFGGPGDPASNVTYSTRVEAEASEEEIDKLCRHTDAVAEIQNSLRALTEVSLDSIKAVSV